MENISCVLRYLRNLGFSKKIELSFELRICPGKLLRTESPKVSYSWLCHSPASKFFSNSAPQSPHLENEGNTISDLIGLSD